MKKIVYIFISLLLVACVVPNDNEVTADFNKIYFENMPDQLQPKNIVVLTGEGDSDSVYKHITFDVTCDQDTGVQKGWFANQTLKKGQTLIGGELVILYQRKDGKWKVTWYELANQPAI